MIIIIIIIIITFINALLPSLDRPVTARKKGGGGKIKKETEQTATS